MIVVRRRAKKVSEPYRLIDGVVKVIQSPYDSIMNGRRYAQIKTGYDAHKKWADECETLKDVLERLSNAEAQYATKESFIWIKYPMSLFSSDQWTVYDHETAPKKIIAEYKSFWKAVVKIYKTKSKEVGKTPTEIFELRLGKSMDVKPIHVMVRRLDT